MLPTVAGRGGRHALAAMRAMYHSLSIYTLGEGLSRHLRCRCRPVVAQGCSCLERVVWHQRQRTLHEMLAAGVLRCVLIRAVTASWPPMGLPGCLLTQTTTAPDHRARAAPLLATQMTTGHNDSWPCQVCRRAAAAQ
jgi:hypothetical protein